MAINSGVCLHLFTFALVTTEAVNQKHFFPISVWNQNHLSFQNQNWCFLELPFDAKSMEAVLEENVVGPNTNFTLSHLWNSSYQILTLSMLFHSAMRIVINL